jgi:glycosyltransferase involved in cell wall biosynthesis
MVQNKFYFIVSAKNAENGIHYCIWSIFNQSYDNWNCFIINNASNDNTMGIIKRFITDIPTKQTEKKNQFRIFERNIVVDINQNIQFCLNLIQSTKNDILILMDGVQCFTTYNDLQKINEIYQNESIMEYNMGDILTKRIK